MRRGDRRIRSRRSQCRLARSAQGLGPLLCLAALASLAGCVSARVAALSIARQHGLAAEYVDGNDYRHLVIRRPGPTGDLHVYIEGDGRPYLSRNHIARDPTSRSLTMLHLMLLDPAASVYIGRPCYFGLAHDRNCDASVWTTRRFAPDVIASMQAVAQAEIAAAAASRVSLFGHSGGGTIATLLASRLPGVTELVTLAGNLDPDQWAALHGYAPLTGSLNPARLGRLPATVVAIHYVGAADTVVPPALVEAAVRSVGGRVIVVPGLRHSCCWERLWPPHPEQTPSAR